MTDRSKELICNMLLRYSYYFDDTYTDYDNQVCVFLWNGKIFEIHKKDKEVVEAIIEKVIKADSIPEEDK